MAMLAEPRRKQRIGPNPRGQLFIEDESNVGRSMLRTMGWKEGDGLGATHQGISVPIKPKIQQDSRGLGFDVKNSPWVVHNDKFSELLADLNVEYCGNDSSEPELKEKVNVETSSAAGNELEMKSKSSRARIHYHKSVKNKDLSKISNKDWSCIFGKSVDMDEKAIRLNPTKINSAEKQAEQETEKFVNGGSMVDYFKTKMMEKTFKQSQHEDKVKQLKDLDNVDSSCARPKRKKYRNITAATGISKDEKLISTNYNLHGIKMHEYEELVNEGLMTVYFGNGKTENLLMETEFDLNLDVMKKKKTSGFETTNTVPNIEQPEKKKKKKRKDVDADVTLINSAVEEIHIKKKKKHKNLDTDIIHQNPSFQEPEKKKKHKNLDTDIIHQNPSLQEPEKKKKHKNLDTDIIHQNPSFQEPEKKKKHKNLDADIIHQNPSFQEPEKKKKHKNLDTELIQQDSNLEQLPKKKKHKNRDTELIEQDSNVEQLPKKKKKKTLDTDEVNEEPSVLLKSPASGDVECNTSDTQSGNNATPKVRQVWDETTVKSVANKYAGANILDMPGYPITPAVYNLHDISL